MSPNIMPVGMTIPYKKQRSKRGDDIVLKWNANRSDPSENG